MTSWLEAPPFAARRRAVAAGEHLLRRLSRPEHLYYLLRGRVAIGLAEGGHLSQRVLDCHGPEWIDPASVLHGLPCSADYVAETPAEVLEVPAAPMRQWTAGLPPGQRQMLLDLALSNRRQTDAALGLMAKDAESRCAQWLLEHAEVTEGGTVAVPLKERKRSIAAQLGIAPETLSRILRHLRESGLITQSGAVLNVIDPRGLRQLAGA